MLFVWISEQAAIISLYSINWLVCITETECLLSGTDCIFIHKGKGHPTTCLRRQRREAELQLQLIRNLGARKGWVVSTTPRPLYPREREPVPIVQEAGWAPGPVWTGTASLALTDIRSPDRPARSESIYRLICRGRQSVCIIDIKLCL
jgi:hypothetical protein